MELAESLKNENYEKSVNNWLLERKHVRVTISQRNCLYNVEFLDQDVGIIKSELTSLMIKYISKKEVNHIMGILRERNFIAVCRTGSTTHIPHLPVSKSGEVYFSGMGDLKRDGHLSKLSQIVFHERDSVSVGKKCGVTTKKVTFNEEGYLKFLSYLEAHNAYDVILKLS
jgi:hypothetical protein